MKPCTSSYGADQFDDADEVEKCHKSSFFNWLYFSTNIGMLIGCSIPVLIQENIGWGWGFGVSAVATAIAVAFFFSGTRVYRYQKSGGNPLTRLCQVLVASLKKYRVEAPRDKSLLYETADVDSAIIGSRKLYHTNQSRFLDKAAVEKQSDHSKGSVNPWRLCTVTQVEELKSIIRLLPVLATGIIFNTVLGQMSNLFLLQAEYMDARLGWSNFRIPVASLAIFNPISVIFWRIGTSLFISIFGMISTGILEIFCLKIVRRHNSYKVMETPIFVFWQVPQHFIIGCAEVFTNIGQLKFFYEEAPDSMRSLCAALSLTTTALGNYVGSLLVAIVMAISTRDGRSGWILDNLNYGHLHYFFLLLAVLSVLNLGVFIVVAKRYTYKEQ
ncbi:UNVERIFIED_CONTAM: protein NRT1/ PTR FAMILY 8.1 [Sesamum latifolium]|uniref:Protein NRT1/ PTR FAMILY 8.1 n=1 Tax=Sesamum latifolium TaxID=2727402 RepID=A0AAW2X6Q5_9LAMI